MTAAGRGFLLWIILSVFLPLHSVAQIPQVPLSVDDVPPQLRPDHVRTRNGAIQVQLGDKMQPVGSGFVFGPQNDVVTCWHVMDGAEKVFHQTNLVFLSFTNRYALKLKYMLPKYDLAVFSPSPKITTAPFSAGDFKKLRPGETIFYIGFDVRKSNPSNSMNMINKSWIAATGCALNDGEMKDAVIVDFLEFPGVGISGYSGGPVCNKDGEVVAILKEAWTRKAVTGGAEDIFNRAFSVEILSVLNEQVSWEKSDK